MRSDVPELPPARWVRRGDFLSAYYTAGPDDGRPLVLCHGLAASGLQFVHDAAWFAERGFRVIVPDLRGHGRSVCPQVRHDEDFSIATLAGDLIGILDAEGISRTDWVGNSLGGILALSLMGIDRERIGRFASFGTAYALDVPEAIVPLLPFSYRLIGREAIARLGAPLTCRRPQGQAIAYAMLRGIDVDAVTRTARQVRHYDFIANAQAFGRPILMIKGVRDLAVNGALKRSVEAMRGVPGFRLVEMTGAGHCANLDRPAPVRKIIADFLTS